MAQIPPTPEIPGPAFQPNMPAYQQGDDTTIQNCSCARCSGVQRAQATPPTWYPIGPQDPRHFNIPHVNQDQGGDNRVETALIAPDRAWTQFVPPQTARTQDNFGYAPIHERVGPSDMVLLRAPTFDTSIAESRRRLAGQYLNNPDAYVSIIRLEPGASGQFQVVITLEMPNVF
ncbi:hypothetical protein EDB85DRAFT_1999613 [Lactarius pseudohatsudake]|nr:hypothetical protein EDB85DRAFT_1999613 [Lactarius pseudohatsudake]